MIAKEFDHCGKHRGIAQPGSQRFRIKSRQSQKSLRARFVFQNPSEGSKDQGLRIRRCFACARFIGG